MPDSACSHGMTQHTLLLSHIIACLIESSHHSHIIVTHHCMHDSACSHCMTQYILLISHIIECLIECSHHYTSYIIVTHHCMPDSACSHCMTQHILLLSHIIECLIECSLHHTSYIQSHITACLTQSREQARNSCSYSLDRIVTHFIHAIDVFQNLAFLITKGEPHHRVKHQANSPQVLSFCCFIFICI